MPMAVEALHSQNKTDQGALESDEHRWQAGSFVALGYALVTALWSIGLIVAIWAIPSDGWSIISSRGFQENFATIGPELFPFGVQLQEGDEVVAINDEPISAIADRTYDFLTLTPPDWPDGTTLLYKVRRGAETLVVEAIIRRITPREMLRVAWTSAGSGPVQRVVAIAGPLSFFAVGLAVFLLRPGSRAAHALFLIGTAFIFNLAPAFASLPSAFYPLPPTSVPFDTWTAVINPSLMYLALVFPRPKWLLRRYPRGGVLLLYLPWLLVFNLNYLLHPGDRAGFYQTNQALYIVQVILLIVLTLGSLVHSALTVREPVARTQFKWLALGLFSFVVIGVGGWLVGYLAGDLLNPVVQAAQLLGQLGWFVLPLSLAIAITRYRLFDIDVIIRRTTSYAIITSLLALVYFGSIVVLQRLLTPFTGESDVAVVLSTLLIAALFLPIRRRVQDVIDHRFNRTRYDAEKTLERFAATARDETDLDALLTELQRVIQETMQPESLSILLFDREAVEPQIRNEAFDSSKM